MKNRIMGLLVLCLMVALPGLTPAEEEILEGFHYQTIPGVSAPTTGPIEVMEFFFYGCPHCYDFEPTLKAWVEQAPKDVRFRRMPAIFSPQWEPLARAFFVAENLGITEKIHQSLFDAIHRDKKALFTRDAIAGFFADHGADRKQFDELYDSFAVQTQINRARQLGRRYGIRGVPTLVVDGQYRTDATMTGSFSLVIKTIDHLLAQQRKLRGG